MYKKIIKDMEKNWNIVRNKLIRGEIEYDDIESLKKELFFDRFDNMFSISSEFATVSLSDIDLILRTVTGKGHDKERFMPLVKDSPKWKELNYGESEWNRYNPSEKSFLYLGVCMNTNRKTYNEVKNTCISELRAFKKDDIKYLSTLEFRVKEDNKNKRVLDFSKIDKYRNTDEIINDCMDALLKA